MAVNWIIEEVFNTGISCERRDCFDDATWFVEGSFYCAKCKKDIVKILKEL